MNKQVSIIIVTHNGFPYVDRCVNSIQQNAYKNTQIIVVDNGSTDDTAKKLQKKFPDIRVIDLPDNIGPAAARNEGLKKATGEYIMFLDNDTQIEADSITNAVKILDKESKVGIIQCKLLMMHDPALLDCTGEFIGQWGFLVHRTEVGQKDDDAQKPEQIFSAKSAGMVIRKKIIDEVGGFDPDFFIYLEETDLAWRAWMHGYTALYVPSSIIYHESGTSSVILSKQTHDFNGKFHGCKNYLLTLLKNLETKNVVRMVPLHVTLWIGLAYFSLFKGHREPWLWIHQAIWWNIIHVGSTLKKRNRIQKKRKKSDNELFPSILRKKTLQYYMNKVNYIKIGNAEGFFKH